VKSPLFTSRSVFYWQRPAAKRVIRIPPIPHASTVRHFSQHRDEQTSACQIE
jgi:hypothetical protein